MPGKVDVRAGEGGAPQRADDRDLVRGVVDGGEAVDQVPYLLGAIDQAAPLDPVGDPGRRQGTFQRREYRSGWDQDCDVAEPGSADRGVPLRYFPAFVPPPPRPSGASVTREEC